MEYKNQITMYKERIDKEKLEYKREIVECEEQIANIRDANSHQTTNIFN